MAKTREQKKEILKKLEEKISQAKSLVLVGYQKIKSKDQERLRKMAKERGGEFMVVKKNLFKLAWQRLNLEKEWLEKIDQEIGLVLGYQDEILPAKICVDFNRENENLKIKAGFFNRRLIDLSEIKFLAILPSKEVLLRQLLFSIRAPLDKFINVLRGNLKSFVYLLHLISQKS
ncbi:MAG: 50S ribosomal protein L10 [Patescibacteria group bacterium]|nr:50S ribosomal protein L10 [Patescibacteria group bacterium]